MTDVLLTHSNHIFADSKQTAKMQPYAPLQTLIGAAALERAGFTVALFDPTFDASIDRFRDALAAYRPRAVFVCEDDFNFITKMCLVQNRRLAFRMAEEARHAGLQAFAHGSDATDHPGDYLDAGFDAVVIGDVEEMMEDLARGRPVEEIPGIAWGTSRNVRFTPRRPPCEDLDLLAPPAWHLVDMQPYREAWQKAHGCFSVNLVTSRGCPYRCNWCAKPVFGNRYRVQSPRRAASELQTVKTLLAPQHIWYADDIFGLSPRWARAFADAVELLDARVPFKMQSRCDLMTRDTVVALQRAGCREVWMGAESGSQRVLDAMDKDIRVADIRVARENLHAHGIRACFFLQFGYPGEQWEDIEQTLQLVRETAPDEVGISISYPLPGTKFHQIVSTQIGPKSNWNDSADLSMMFRGEFSTEFYRALARAVHAEMKKTPDAAAAWRLVDELRTTEGAAVA